jgi:hypothetical protein
MLKIYIYIYYFLIKLDNKRPDLGLAKGDQEVRTSD